MQVDALTCKCHYLHAQGSSPDALAVQHAACTCLSGRAKALVHGQAALSIEAVLSAEALLTSCTQCFAKLVNFSDLGIFAQLCPAHE